jgi:hypothetical protein
MSISISKTDELSLTWRIYKKHAPKPGQRDDWADSLATSAMEGSMLPVT